MSPLIRPLSHCVMCLIAGGRFQRVTKILKFHTRTAIWAQNHRYWCRSLRIGTVVSAQCSWWWCCCRRTTRRLGFDDKTIHWRISISVTQVASLVWWAAGSNISVSAVETRIENEKRADNNCETLSEFRAHCRNIDDLYKDMKERGHRSHAGKSGTEFSGVSVSDGNASHNWL